jgi:hypothetical protein
VFSPMPRKQTEVSSGGGKFSLVPLWPHAAQERKKDIKYILPALPSSPWWRSPWHETRAVYVTTSHSLHLADLLASEAQRRSAVNP